MAKSADVVIWRGPEAVSGLRFGNFTKAGVRVSPLAALRAASQAWLTGNRLLPVVCREYGYPLMRLAAVDGGRMELAESHLQGWRKPESDGRSGGRM